MPELSQKPRIALGADHAGYHIKETVRQFLENAGYPVDDLGTWSEESVDYPDFGKAVADRVAAHQDLYGIAVCGTGMGMSIAANKVPGIRAAVAHNVDTARLAREHNDANVLAMGGRVVNGTEAIEMVQAFLSTTFAGGRHARRVEKITQIEAAERG
ncbi:MAG: ribose 5-phosphate isomerase B [Candidatus Acidiferrum sp.]|jgi:ribose 5-phosphate isomerase B